jgi:hypothetical protein
MAATSIGVDPDAAWHFVRDHIGADDLGCFVGFLDGVPQGIALAVLPTTPFMLRPQVLLAYVRRSPDRNVAKAIGKRMRAWLEEKGYRTALAMRRGSDAQVNPANLAFMRVTRHFGQPTVWGAVLAYEFA